MHTYSIHPVYGTNYHSFLSTDFCITFIAMWFERLAVMRKFIITALWISPYNKMMFGLLYAGYLTECLQNNAFFFITIYMFIMYGRLLILIAFHRYWDHNFKYLGAASCIVAVASYIWVSCMYIIIWYTITDNLLWN